MTGITDQKPNYADLMKVFLPEVARQFVEASAEGKRFVHYTSAENAFRILNGKEIWMRNTRCMNDYSEINHGIDCLNKYLNDEKRRKAFVDAVNLASPGAAEEALRRFEYHLNSIRLDTYITCISEHDVEKEDRHGRLSMWRAYGTGGAGAAIVLKPTPFFMENDNIGAFSSPVIYADDVRLSQIMDDSISSIRRNRYELSYVDKNVVMGSIFSMLYSLCVCVKHPGFREEREWRIIFNPILDKSSIIKMDLAVIKGIPQKVCRFPFSNNPDLGITGIDLTDFFDKVIIGPSNYPTAIYDAIVACVDAAGIRGGDSRVQFSGIPLRN